MCTATSLYSNKKITAVQKWLKVHHLKLTSMTMQGLKPSAASQQSCVYTYQNVQVVNYCGMHSFHAFVPASIVSTSELLYLY